MGSLGSDGPTGPGPAADGDHHALLGLDRNADEATIRQRITTERRKWRRRTTAPDINARQEAERWMQALDAAERALLPAGPPSTSAHGASSAPHAAEATEPPETPPAAQRPGPPPVAPAAREWLVRAVEQLKGGQSDLAIFTARRAVDEDPQNAYAWSVLADAAARSDDSETANSAIERALALEPESAHLHAERGWILDRGGRPERAVAAYRTAAELDPSRIDYRVRIVTALLRAGRVDEAVRDAEDAYRLRPDDGDVRTALGTALAERAVAAQHELPDGRLVIASEAQASYVLALASRGISVRPADPAVLEDLEQQREYARRARRRRFSPNAFRRNWRWPVGLGLLLVSGCCCAPNIYRASQTGDLVQQAFAVGVLIVVLTFVGALLYTCYEPVYKRNAALIAETVPRRVGRGPGDRQGGGKGREGGAGGGSFRPEPGDPAPRTDDTGIPESRGKGRRGLRWPSRGGGAGGMA
ncbi:tetratricopeptide repeat protein [Cryptosporangium aurantiacum]|uniref:Tfp pilus assembly protein PilF n=1 Tax=Cryptosporangium aurantiacum TaxID=134849 RepID=A0A1M7RED9_9ACTN|nr:tetratricopeptide repeat protein [Cryptosporangium aurantiacum]SHN44594.1 Tfp pilus assembly protein PilF [Cryptosporangium aurantiacum]